MKIVSRQAAEILGCSVHTMANLVKKGKLKDYGITKEGEKKHIFRFELKEVRELAKATKNNGRYRFSKPAPQTPQEPIVKIRFQPDEPSRLDRIEAKLDQLLKMWS